MIRRILDDEGIFYMINVIVVGVGEYVTGLSPSRTVSSDKDLGVVALCLFDMRQRGLVQRIILAGRDARRRGDLESHFQSGIGSLFNDLDLSFDYVPEALESAGDLAYLTAFGSVPAGAAVIICTPDSTHFEIAKAAMEYGHHVLVAKPLVKTVEEHLKLLAAAEERGVLGMVEYHKRYDPIYRDAIARSLSLGRFNYMFSFMSQPKSQLQTFMGWAGIDSDINYYLNSHHVDILSQMINSRYRPLRVFASCSAGIGSKELNRPIADTISLTVDWECLATGEASHSVHTASWVAPKSDAHSQQRFVYLGEHGQIEVDQARRGYSLATDHHGLRSLNPLFMNYTPCNGKFMGQDGYGYKSIESFVVNAAGINQHSLSTTAVDAAGLPTFRNTLITTAILQAGADSLRTKAPVNVRIPLHANPQ